MFVYISLALLAVSCVLLAWVARELGKQLRVLVADMRVAEARLNEAYKNDVEFDHRVTELKRTMAAAEDLIKEHAELEKEAVKSEQLFQEGLANILSYGVVKNE